jgi:hypothetical protein
MKAHINQNGIGHIVAVGVVLFLLVVGFAGYKVITMNKVTNTAASTAAATGKVPNTISSKADLVQASKALDNSSTQVDSSLNDSSLDADLNDML